MNELIMYVTDDKNCNTLATCNSRSRATWVMIFYFAQFKILKDPFMELLPRELVQP